MTKKWIFIIPLALCFSSACQDVQTNEKNCKKEVETEEQTSEKSEQHPYGGWFCPDNLKGFPPANIKELDKLPVVNHRLPTKEETQDGTSLMFIDTTEYPGAKAMDIDLPQVARIHSSHNGIDELVIVIQAVVVGEDTVVGYRFPNGGNGSAWYSDVSFLSNQELSNTPDMPFVFLKDKVNSSKTKVWEAFCKTDYALKLSEMFDQDSFFVSKWTDESKAHLHYESEEVNATGIVMNFWGNLYLHIDYKYDNLHYSEKMLVGQNADGSEVEIILVSGPHPEGYEDAEKDWQSWMEKMKL